MKKIQIELSPDQFVTMYYALRKAIIYTKFFDPEYSGYTLPDPEKQKFLDSYKQLYGELVRADGWFSGTEVNIYPGDVKPCDDLHAKVIEREE